MIKNASTTQSALSGQTIVIAAIAWAVFALLFFLLFSVSPSDSGHPKWYSTMTYLLEEVAFLGAGLLCFRNWRSSQIVSGGTVWLAIGLGMFSYFTGNLLLGYWEIGLDYSPDFSPGDFFFVLTYICLGWGMLRAVLARRLNLTPVQWGILSVIAVGGIILAILSAPNPEPTPTGSAPPALEQAAASPAESVQHAPTSKAVSAPKLTPSPKASPFQSAPFTASASPVPSPAVPAVSSTPGWAVTLEHQLAPLGNIVSWLYIIGDVILVVMATALLLAFWGGRFSLSWRFIAAAAFSYYIADIWFNYATNYIPNYQTGSLPEVFWIFSGCLFAIGATLEYDLSNRRRSIRRRN